MRIYYDTEFLEDGNTIELISIGMVAEDGREYYAVNRDMPHKRIAKHDWLMANVVPSLPRLHGDALPASTAGRRSNPLALDWQHPDVKSRYVIASHVRQFIQATPEVELWTWYGAYDHVALCQLWGAMVDLPHGVPMYTHDLKQECDRLGNPKMPEQLEGLHNALTDARHVKTMAESLSTSRPVCEGQIRAKIIAEVDAIPTYDAARGRVDDDRGHEDHCEWHTTNGAYCSCRVWPAAFAGVDAALEVIRGAYENQNVAIAPDDLAELLAYVIGDGNIRVVHEATLERAFTALKAVQKPVEKGA